MPASNTLPPSNHAPLATGYRPFALGCAWIALTLSSPPSSAQAQTSPAAYSDNDAGIEDVAPPPAAALDSDSGVAPGTNTAPTVLELTPTEVVVYGERVERAVPGAIEPHGTGSRVNAPLEQIPASIAVVDDRAMRERGAYNLEQALNVVPGITPVWTYGGFLYLSMRGFQAATLYDGFRDTRNQIVNSAPQGALFDLDRIEVLRGPSSVLYGYGAVGGVVNLIRRHASRKREYTLNVSIGLPDQQSMHAGAQGPIGKHFAYRIDVGRVTSKNYRGATTERNQATTSLLFTPARNHTFGLRLSYNIDHYNTDVGIPTAELGDKPGTWGLPPGARTEARYNTKNDFLDYQRLELSADYRFDISRVTYAQARFNISRDQYDYLAAEQLNYVPAADMMPATVDREYLHFITGWTPVVGQLELHSELQTWAIKHALVLGYELGAIYGKGDRGDNGDAVPGSVNFRYPQDMAVATHDLQLTSQDRRRFVSNSVYGFDHMHLLDNLIVTGGLRYDDVSCRARRVFFDRETGVEGPDPSTGRTRSTLRKSDGALTGQVGAVYTPVQPLTVYAGYSTAFKPVFVRPADESVNDFKPERSQQVEGGIRVRARTGGHRIDLDGAVYFIQKRNVVQPRGSDDFDQAGRVESRGLDVALHYSAPRVLSVDASYALTQAEFKEFIATNPVSGEQRDLAGKQPNFTPLHMGQLWLRFALNDAFAIAVGGRWVGKQFADQDNRLPLSAYALLDMSASWQVDPISVVISARNLFDEREYFTSAIRASAVNPQITPGPSREIMASLRLTL